MFITFEGIEGAGKSTQAARLAERLRAAGHAVRQTREPGGTPLADGIRALLLLPDASLDALRAAQVARPGDPVEPMLPLTEVLLLSAARAQHVVRMRAWLAAGEIVLCDRYADTTRAYQGAARGEDMRTIETLEQLATGGLRPDLTLLLDLPPTEGLHRKDLAHEAGEKLDRIDQEELAFHERVRAGYLALATAEPNRWVILNANQPQDALAEQIWQAVQGRLPATNAE